MPSVRVGLEIAHFDAESQSRRVAEIRRVIPKEMQAILCASSASLRLCVKVREFPNSLSEAGEGKL